jgi:hypothetical protein
MRGLMQMNYAEGNYNNAYFAYPAHPSIASGLDFLHPHGIAVCTKDV